MGNSIQSKAAPRTKEFRTDISLLFIFWPLAALVFALKHFRSNWSKNVVWLFTIFFGYTFVIISSDYDASRYKDALIFMANSPFSFSTIFTDYLSEDSGVLDIAQRLVTFIVSRFTDDYRVLFAVFGFFMGYFLSRIIWFVIERTTGKISLFSGVFLVSFSLVVGIWDMGGIRWNIAAIIFFYGAIIFLVDGNIKGLWITTATIFVHWSFPLALVVLFIYSIIRNQTTFFFILFVVSFFVGEINLDNVRLIFQTYAPFIVQETRSSYLDPQYIESLAEGTKELGWYVLGHVQILKWYIFAVAVYFYFWGRKKFLYDAPLANLFSFSLLFYGVFNYLASIPSIGRFIAIGNLLMLSLFFFNLQKFKHNFPILLRAIGYPALLLFIVVRIRIGFDCIGIWTVLGNPLYVYFVENNIPLIDLVKELL